MSEIIDFKTRKPVIAVTEVDVKQVKKDIARYYMDHSGTETFYKFEMYLDNKFEIRKIFKDEYKMSRNKYLETHPYAPRSKRMMQNVAYDPAFKIKHSSFKFVPRCCYPCSDNQIYEIGNYYLDHSASQVINMYNHYCYERLDIDAVYEVFKITHDGYCKTKWLQLQSNEYCDKMIAKYYGIKW